MTDRILLARAFLSRVAEPANLSLWAFVEEAGPLAAVSAIRSGDCPEPVRIATSARLATVDPEADLETAERHGIRLVTPESGEWPHFAFGALARTGAARLAARSGRADAARSPAAPAGEPVPPLALWVRGSADLASIGVRAIAIVGSRAATEYGLHVASDFAYALARRDVVVVSGGAYGIDGAAHRAALAAGGVTVVVSAGGLDRPYPAGNADVFRRAAAEGGLIVSEVPPGAAPHRARFLSRNRLIAAFGAATLVVEAARRSGARNTVTHSLALGRPVLAVPGPVTSGFSVGCHDLIRRPENPAILVGCVEHVLELVGDIGDLSADRPAAPATHTAKERRRDVIDALDITARQVFEGLQVGRPRTVDELIAVTALPLRDVLRALPALELVGLAVQHEEGWAVAPLDHRDELPPGQT